MTSRYGAATFGELQATEPESTIDPALRPPGQFDAVGVDHLLAELRRVLVPRILDDPIELDGSRLTRLLRVRRRERAMDRRIKVCRFGRALKEELGEALNGVAGELEPRNLVGRLAEGLASGLSQTVIAESAGVTASHLSRRKRVLARLVLDYLLAEDVHTDGGDVQGEGGPSTGAAQMRRRTTNPTMQPTSRDP